MKIASRRAQFGGPAGRRWGAAVSWCVYVAVLGINRGVVNVAEIA